MPLQDQVKNAVIKQNFELIISDKTFIDPDNDELEITIMSELPEWMKFNSQSLKFEGVPTSRDPIVIVMRATDVVGHFIED
jgi:hypothetical protein